MKALLPGPQDWVWWVVFYGFFVAINILGAEMSFGVSMAITAAAAAVLLIFYAGVIGTGAFAWEHALEGKPFLPQGWYGVFAALPYAVWFYLAIEQLPLSAEESHDVARDMPKALTWGMASLLVLSCGTLILNSGIPVGAEAVGKSAAPLELGFQTVFRGRATSTGVVHYFTYRADRPASIRSSTPTGDCSSPWRAPATFRCGCRD
jgi:ethanolamine permease